MTLEEFVAGSGQFHPPALRALWLANRGEWEQAHEVAQSDDNPEGAWVHAYLHRVEGDTANAGYWYRRAHRPTQSGDLHTEWQSIVTELLQRVV
ncbi:hypothetical protein [Granulicella arctica]|uniref:hypothetical protein n=1 Tax=Granulicella arctica TaxID=940613 RepID=UPI0021E04CD2|nr:hypothetical protein [Granulicella arctica]